MFELCDVLERLRHFDGILPSLACILMKQHCVRGGKYLLKTPGKTISETLNLKMSLDAVALKNLCLCCEFQSRLLHIINLLLKNVLTALRIFQVHKAAGKDVNGKNCKPFFKETISYNAFLLYL